MKKFILSVIVCVISFITAYASNNESSNEQIIKGSIVIENEDVDVYCVICTDNHNISIYSEKNLKNYKINTLKDLKLNNITICKNYKGTRQCHFNSYNELVDFGVKMYLKYKSYIDFDKIF